jgi:hypothetical protein
MSLVEVFTRQRGPYVPNSYADRIGNDKMRALGIIGNARASQPPLPHISALEGFEHLLFPVDGMYFHNGQRGVVINKFWSDPDTTKKRAALLGTFAGPGDGRFAIIDNTGEMYLAPALYEGNDRKIYSLGYALAAAGFQYKPQAMVPINGDDVLIGPINYDLPTSTQPDIRTHERFQMLMRERVYTETELKNLTRGYIPHDIKPMKTVSGIKRAP